MTVVDDADFRAAPATLDYARPPGYGGPTPGLYRSNGGRTRRLKVAALAFAGMEALSIGVFAWDAYQWWRHEAGTLTQAEIDRYQSISVPFGFAHLAVALVTFVLLLMWLNRAQKNTQALGDRLDYTPGWGIAYWFIPILNLFRPYNCVGEVWDKNVTAIGGPAGTLVGWWWAAWLTSDIVGNVVTRIERRSEVPSTLIAADYINVAVAVVSIVSLWLLVRVVTQIQAGQADRAGAATDFGGPSAARDAGEL